MSTRHTDRRKEPRNVPDRRQQRRVATRTLATLSTGLSLLDAEASEPTTTELEFMAEVRDLSPDGVAFAVSHVTVDERYCQQQPTVRLMLHLPVATVPVRAQIMHCRMLDARHQHRGWLLGGRIVGIDEQVHRQLIAYLAGQNAGEQ
ncbi:MAG: PilZ domain-containing protein [Pyrinomonadaceae bacterium]